MKIQDLFLKPVERPIEGVIKADDQRHLLTEVEEFVVTREIGKGLDDSSSATSTRTTPMAFGFRDSLVRVSPTS